MTAMNTASPPAATATDSATPAATAAAALDQHVRNMVRHHFSPETGTPYWIDWAAEHRIDPISTVHSFIDLLQTFPNFNDDALRYTPIERWVPRAFAQRPFKIFETGGTTGMPKQRLSWDDHLHDYTEFANRLDDQHFPPGAAWLMAGPTGPRRLRLTIEHVANLRGGPCYFLDLDPRWVKRLIAGKRFDEANAYKNHVLDQACEILKNRRITCLFTTPKLLEGLGERLSLPDAGIKGVFCGGTSMTPQEVRFLVEEVLENRARLVATYGNTLMGLAVSRPLAPEDKFSLTYYAPQPRAVLRIVQTDQTDKPVGYAQYGRVELTTLTPEFFMPRFLERDEAIRRPPAGGYAWDGVGDVRPLGSMSGKIVEGVY